MIQDGSHSGDAWFPSPITEHLRCFRLVRIPGLGDVLRMTATVLSFLPLRFQISFCFLPQYRFFESIVSIGKLERGREFFPAGAGRLKSHAISPRQICKVENRPRAGNESQSRLCSFKMTGWFHNVQVEAHQRSEPGTK